MNRAFVLGLGCLGVIVVILLMFGGAIAGGYNSLVQSSTSVDASWAQVQTQYQRRADLIPNLVRTVEGAPSSVLSRHDVDTASAPAPTRRRPRSRIGPDYCTRQL